jgi:hypothetical protein
MGKVTAHSTPTHPHPLPAHPGHQHPEPLRGAVKEIERRELAPIIKAQVERDRELQELADEINPPDFDPIENADQVRQRGEFTGLCTDMAKVPPPARFIARHDGKLRPDHVEPARAALAWLIEFIREWEARRGPSPRA